MEVNMNNAMIMARMTARYKKYESFEDFKKRIQRKAERIIKEAKKTGSVSLGVAQS